MSDNTATDVLLDYVGREAVEARAPGNTPFMSTRDAFVLKAKTNDVLLGRWREAGPVGRRKMLLELQSAKLEVGDFTGDIVVPMRRARGIQAKKISVSVSKEDLARLSRRAKRLYSGNISALIHEMAEQAEKQEAIDKLWESLGKPTVSEEERKAIIGEWFA